MTHILLVRHGNTDLLKEYLCGRSPGISLNEEGRKQARELGQRFFNRYCLAAVYSSPLERAFQTACGIAEPQRLTIRIDDDLNEIDFGRWTGARFSDLQTTPEWSAYNRNRSFSSAPEGETLIGVQDRAWKSLRSIAARHENQTVAAVSHGDVIRSILMLILGMPLDNILRLEILPASVAGVVLGGSSPIVEFTNYTVEA